MAKPELGTKRACTSCGARFYDLNKMPVVCPKCEASFIPEILLPSKETAPVEPKAAPPPVTEEVKKEDTADVEVVSLEDVIETDDDDEEDDEIAAIADVDLGDDEEDDVKPDADDNTFLETDTEDDSDVTGLIGGVAGGKDES